MKMKTTHLLLFNKIFFFILLVFSNVIILKGLSDESLTPRFTFVAIFLLIILFAIFSEIKNSVKRISIPDVLLILFYIWNLLSITWAANRPEAIFETQKIFLFVFVYFVSIFFLKRSYSTAIKSISIGVIVCVTIICILGFSKFYEIYIRGHVNRQTIRDIIGLSGNKNLLAGLCVLFLPFITYGVAIYRKWRRWIFICMWFLLLFLIYILDTRSTILATSLMMLTWGVLLLIQNLRKIRKTLLKIVFITPLVTFLLFMGIYFSGYLFELFEYTNIASPNSPTGTWLERIIIWSNNRALTLEYPLLGVGAGNWDLQFPLFGMDNLAHGANFSSYLARPHNDFLLILSELGIVGLTIWLAVLVSFGRALFLKINLNNVIENRLAILLFGGIIGYAIFAFFSFPKERIEHLVLLAIMFALINHLCSNHIKTIAMPWKTKKWVALVSIPILLFTVYLGAVRVYYESAAFKMSAAYIVEDYSLLQQLSKDKTHLFYNVASYGTPIPFYEGVSALAVNDLNKAILKLESAKKCNPGFLGIYANLGTAYFRSKEYKKAILNYEQVLRISSKHQGTLFNLSLLYLELNNLPKSHFYINLVDNSHPGKAQLINKFGL